MHNERWHGENLNVGWMYMYNFNFVTISSVYKGGEE